MPYTGWYQPIPQIDWEQKISPVQEEMGKNLQSLVENQQRQQQLDTSKQESQQREQQMAIQAQDRAEQQKANVEKAKALAEKERVNRMERELESKALQATLEASKVPGTSRGKQAKVGLDILINGGATKAAKDAYAKINTLIDNAPTFAVANDYSENVLGVPLDPKTWAPKGGIKTATTGGRIYNLSNQQEILADQTAAARAEDAKAKALAQQNETNIRVAGQKEVAGTQFGFSKQLKGIPQATNTPKEMKDIGAKVFSLQRSALGVDQKIARIREDYVLLPDEKDAMIQPLLVEKALIDTRLKQVIGAAPPATGDTVPLVISPAATPNKKGKFQLPSRALSGK